VTQTSSDEARRYRILDVVGEGGFGKVYRARLEGAEGFAKDVAIKLLTDDEAPDEVIQRFRDESRILGLIRDRAIVTVDPPTRLEGRWAVVMEFVDGANCQRLLKANPIPPRPAVEIVQEVARALDNVYGQAGPDGEPLHLIHRDIKPGNIQVTPAGTVKVLDFGIARATFSARESRTTTHIGGTFGYIAPERLQGEEGPRGDIYSLGVVLATMLCGRRPTHKNRNKLLEWIDQDPDLQAVWALAERMQNPNWDERPSAREVEDACAALGPGLRGGPLRRWAEREVHEVSMAGDDVLIGNVLTETLIGVSRTGTAVAGAEQEQPGRNPWVLALMGSVGLALFLIGLIGLSAGLGYVAANSGSQEDGVAVAVQPSEPVVEAEDLVEEPAAPVVEEPVVPEPVVEQPIQPAPVVPTVSAVAPRPAPAPKPAPTAAVSKLPVTFGSIPVGATVLVDGRRIGKSPIVGYPLPLGSHRIEMRMDGTESTKSIKVGKRSPVRYIWKGGEEWQVFY